MHILSREDLNSAGLEIVRVSRNPTTAITANGEVQTNEEATVYVYDLDLFLTEKILEDTPSSSIAWKTLRRSRIFLLSGPVVKKTHLLEKGGNIQCHTENCVPVGPPSLTTSTSPTTVSQDSMADDSTPIPQKPKNI